MQTKSYLLQQKSVENVIVTDWRI